MSQLATPDTLTLIRPDDWHVHLRDGAALATVVPDTARQFARAIVMPNLKPPVTTASQALAYADRIRAAIAPLLVGERPRLAGASMLRFG
jgi:dihydroorotase